MIPVFDDPLVLAPNLSSSQVIASTFVPDPEGSFEFDGKRFRDVYFPVDRDATDAQMREICFEIHNGQPMDDYQRWALSEAQSGA